jgi:hypothetical protein
VAAEQLLTSKGWERRQRSRMLCSATIVAEVRLLRRVRDSADRWPWEWTASDLEDFISDLASAPHHRRPATLRNCQSQLRGFLDYLVDERYRGGWCAPGALTGPWCSSLIHATRSFTSATMRAIPADDR